MTFYAVESKGVVSQPFQVESKAKKHLEKVGDGRIVTFLSLAEYRAFAASLSEDKRTPTAEVESRVNMETCVLNNYGR